MTWEGLFDAIDDANYKTAFKIGDEIQTNVTGTNTPMVMQIAAFDADVNADTEETAPVALVCKNLWYKHRYNPAKEDYTSGTGTLGGFDASELHAYLATLYGNIQADVRTRIIPVKKYTRIFDASTETAVNDCLTTETLFVPSCREMGGGVETMGPVYSQLFPTERSRKKYTTVDGLGAWWLRTANKANSEYAIGHDTGNLMSASTTYANYWVVPCFCVG